MVWPSPASPALTLGLLLSLVPSRPTLCRALSLPLLCQHSPAHLPHGTFSDLSRLKLLLLPVPPTVLSTSCLYPLLSLAFTPWCQLLSPTSSLVI